MSAVDDAGPLAEPVAEARRLIAAAAGQGIERLLANLESSPLDPGEAARVQGRLEALRRSLEAEPKSMKWRLRSQVGDKVRWYQQPEEEGSQDGARP